MDINEVVNTAKEKATEIKEKVENVDWEELKYKAEDEIKSIDMGVLYTKAQDVASRIDIKSKKQAVRKLFDFDTPRMDKIKGTIRTVGDFMGYIPYYAQSVPNMVKEALGLDKANKQ